jgi:RND family efflux transporter MFP subunit
MKKTIRRIIHFLITLIIIGAGAAAFIVLSAGKPQLKRTKPPTPTPIVKTAKIVTGPQSIVIKGEGTVKPTRQIQLVPEVSGRISFVSPALVDGGKFNKGETLLRIDPVDYQLAVTLAQARVKDSESRLRVTEEEAAAAKEEWFLIYEREKKAGKQPPALVAKEPQLQAAKAKLAADRADLRKAKLYLERTELKAPFNGLVSEESVDIGQYVSVGQRLATLFSTNSAEIVIPFEDEALFWFHVPGFTPGDGPGSAVKVRTRVAGRELTRPGRVMRAEGKLDERTRMVNVVVRVDNPYASKPPLAAGLFVTVEIQGSTLQNAAAIPRTALRKDNMVWLVDESGSISFREVEIARLLPNTAILKSGVQDGEILVTSGLKAVTEGMKVRIASRRSGRDS